MKTISPFQYGCLIGLICCLCGCRGPSNDQAPLQNASSPKDLESAPESDRNLAEKTRIKLLLMEDLGLLRKTATTNSGAYFVEVDDDEIGFFERRFENNVPRIDFSINRNGQFENLTMLDGVVIDKVTKKPGIVYAFQEIQIDGDQVTVEVVEYFSVVGATVHRYDLVARQGQWAIRSHSRKSVS